MVKEKYRVTWAGRDVDHLVIVVNITVSGRLEGNYQVVELSGVTHHTTNASVSCCMRIALIALSSILESVVSVARFDFRAIAPLEAGEVEAAAETISATLVWKTRRVQVQSEIGEWAIGYATIFTSTIAPEPRLVIENYKLVDGKGSIVDLLNVGALVPVRLCASIATLLL